MQTFKDRTGRAWSIEISVTDASRLIAAGINGYEIVSDMMPTEGGEKCQKASELIENPGLVLTGLYLLCRDDAKAAGIHDEDSFGKLFKGPEYEEASLALVKEIVDFFASPALSRALLKLMDKLTPRMATDRAKADDLLGKAIDDLDLDQLLGNSNGSPGSSAASSAPTPAA